MRVATIPRALAALLGGGLALYTGYLVVRGPFFDGPTLDPVPLMYSLAGFLLGVIVFTWGASRLAGVGARL